MVDVLRGGTWTDLGFFFGGREIEKTTCHPSLIKWALRFLVVVNWHAPNIPLLLWAHDEAAHSQLFLKLTWPRDLLGMWRGKRRCPLWVAALRISVHFATSPFHALVTVEAHVDMAFLSPWVPDCSVSRTSSEPIYKGYTYGRNKRCFKPMRFLKICFCSKV